MPVQRLGALYASINEDRTLLVVVSGDVHYTAVPAGLGGVKLIPLLRPRLPKR